MRRHLPSLAALEAFDAVARSGSTTRAADSLGRTQSAVSRQITNLEGFAGRQLFDRHQNRLVLNPAGRFLFDSLGHVLDRLERITTQTVAFAEDSRTITLQVWPTFAARWLTARLAIFERTFPDIQIDLRLAIGHTLDFQRDDLDAAILYGSGDWDGLVSAELLREEIVAVTTSNAVERLGYDIMSHDHLYMKLRESAWELWLKERTPYKQTKAGRSYAVSLLIEVACLGQGVAVLPSIYVAQELAAGRLIAPFGPPISSGRGYHLCYTVEKASRPELIAFRDWLLRGGEQARVRAGPSDG